MNRLLTLFLLLIGISHNAFASEGLGLRVGAGTDITGGIAYGLGINYLTEFDSQPVELGIVLYSGNFEEETEEFHTYKETTDVFVFGALANFLFRYNPQKPGVYYVAGIGIGAISVDWEEKSATDTSLGTPLANGGSKQSADGSAAGSILNFGIGTTFSGGFDLRLEIPIIISFDSPGESSSVVPTLTLSAGLRL
jgi:hypothetical protein